MSQAGAENVIDGQKIFECIISSQQQQIANPYGINLIAMTRE